MAPVLSCFVAWVEFIVDLSPPDARPHKALCWSTVKLLGEGWLYGQVSGIT